VCVCVCCAYDQSTPPPTVRRQCAAAAVVNRCPSPRGTAHLSFAIRFYSGRFVRAAPVRTRRIILCPPDRTAPRLNRRHIQRRHSPAPRNTFRGQAAWSTQQPSSSIDPDLTHLSPPARGEALFLYFISGKRTIPITDMIIRDIITIIIINAFERRTGWTEPARKRFDASLGEVRDGGARANFRAAVSLHCRFVLFFLI